MGRKVLATLVAILGIGVLTAAAAAASGDRVVLAPAKVSDRHVLFKLLRAAKPAAEPARPSGFRVLAEGYLKPRDYDLSVGRLYSIIPPNGKYVEECTATVVAPNVVLTAAHCVYDLKSGRQDMGYLFVPGMDGSSEPAGTWDGTASAYWSRWARAPRASLDYAFVTLKPNQRGQNVADLTGYHRIVEYARPGRVFVEGYPASGPFSKRCTFTSCFVTYCYSPLGGIFSGSYGSVLGIGCLTAQGSSGGPWFVRSHGRFAIGSVTAIGFNLGRARYARAIFGPQFGSSLQRLLKAAERG